MKCYVVSPLEGHVTSERLTKPCLPAHLCCSCRALASALEVRGKMYFKTKANSHAMPFTREQLESKSSEHSAFLKRVPEERNCYNLKPDHKFHPHFRTGVIEYMS